MSHLDVRCRRPDYAAHLNAPRRLVTEYLPLCVERQQLRYVVSLLRRLMYRCFVALLELDTAFGSASCHADTM